MSSLELTKRNISIRAIILCGLFAALTALGAFIKIPIPPVPFTLQTLFVLLCAILLGSVRGAISQAVYVGLGLLGLPVFAGAGGGGIGYVLKPSFGYLLGFIIGAFVIGKIIETQKDNNLFSVFLASLIGIFIIYTVGVIYLYLILNLYLKTATPFYSVLYSGVIVFAPKDIVFCVVASIAGTQLIPVLKRQNLL